MLIKIKPQFLRNEKEAYSLISKTQLQFYVYVLVNPVTRVPFYVGKGQGERCFSHYYNKNIEDNPKSRYLRKIKLKPLYFFYLFCDDEDFAYSREALLIYKLGLKTKRVQEGILYNISEGQGEYYFKYKTTSILKSLEESENGKSGKYDYSKVVYKGSGFFIDVICKEHGLFKTTAYRHITGTKCPKCAGQNLETEDIIKKSIKIHGDKYDYSLVKYTGIRENIDILCKTHGKFSMTPNRHYLMGWGCPKCSGRGNTITTGDMVARFIDRHGDKYDYSKVEYIDSRTEVVVTCKKHGDFTTLCKPHYKGGTGCPKCSVRNRTTEQVIDTLKSVMGDNYTFEKTIYTKAIEAMIITCKVHGDFSLSYNKIVSSGRGCPKCGMDRLKLPRS